MITYLNCCYYTVVDKAPFTDPKFMTLVLMVLIVYLRDCCPFSGLFWYKGMLMLTVFSFKFVY